jgi:hypothetical protein
MLGFVVEANNYQLFEGVDFILKEHLISSQVLHNVTHFERGRIRTTFELKCTKWHLIFLLCHLFIPSLGLLLEAGSCTVLTFLYTPGGSQQAEG